MREDMYKLVSAVDEKHKQSPLKESPENLRLLDKMNKDYIRNGLGLSEKERERFKTIKKELSILGIDFSKRLNEENGGIWFTKEELDGLPEDVLSGLKTGEKGSENDGKYRLSFKYG
jgi:metallopeptidase MepB